MFSENWLRAYSSSCTISLYLQRFIPCKCNNVPAVISFFVIFKTSLLFFKNRNIANTNRKMKDGATKEIYITTGVISLFSVCFFVELFEQDTCALCVIISGSKTNLQSLSTSLSSVAMKLYLSLSEWRLQIFIENSSRDVKSKTIILQNLFITTFPENVKILKLGYSLIFICHHFSFFYSSYVFSGCIYDTQNQWCLSQLTPDHVRSARTSSVVRVLNKKTICYRSINRTSSQHLKRVTGGRPIETFYNENTWSRYHVVVLAGKYYLHNVKQNSFNWNSPSESNPARNRIIWNCHCESKPTWNRTISRCRYERRPTQNKIIWNNLVFIIKEVLPYIAYNTIVTYSNKFIRNKFYLLS